MSSKASVSFRLPNKTCMYLSSTPYVPHVPPILSSLISSPEQHMVSSRKHEAPHYATFSSHQLFSHFQLNQPTRCSSFLSLLLDVYVQFSMFRAPSCPSSGATTAVAASGLPSELGDSSAVGRRRAGPARPRPTALSPRSNGKTRGCYCSC